MLVKHRIILTATLTAIDAVGKMGLEASFLLILLGFSHIWACRLCGEFISDKPEEVRNINAFWRFYDHIVFGDVITVSVKEPFMREHIHRNQ
jgi:hypothetical protein